MTSIELNAAIILARNYLTMLEMAWLEHEREEAIRINQRESDLDALNNWLDKTDLYEEYEFYDGQDRGEI